MYGVSGRHTLRSPPEKSVCIVAKKNLPLFCGVTVINCNLPPVPFKCLSHQLTRFLIQMSTLTAENEVQASFTLYTEILDIVTAKICHHRASYARHG